MNRFLMAVASIGLVGLGLAPSARADEWDKKTVLTVNETIQVPNKVLPPGTYVIKLFNSVSDRHIVQIFNADDTELITTILAIPNYRLQPTEKTAVTFWEMPPGEPKALRAWFYPGDNFGQEFAYPKTAAVTIAATAHAEVPTTEAIKPAEMDTAPILKMTERGSLKPFFEALMNPPPSAATPAPEPPAALPEAPIAIPTELPKTASPYPLIGLAGALAVFIFAVVRVVRTTL